MIVDKPLSDMHFRVLDILQEFKGLKGLEDSRLPRELKAPAAAVGLCLVDLRDLDFVHLDGSTRKWMITMKGEAALSQPLTVRPAGSMVPTASIVFAPPNEVANEENEYPIAEPPPEPKQDKPDVWFVCGEIGDDGKKCERQFASPQARAVHITRSHGEHADKSLEEKHICDECDPPKEFKSAESLYGHQSAMHVAAERRTCSKCGKVFSSPGAKGSHERACNGPAPPDKPSKKIGRPSVGKNTWINDRIIELYPDHTTREICAELSMNRKAVAKRVTVLIRKGQLQRKGLSPSSRISHTAYYDEIKRLRESGLMRKDIAAKLKLSQNVVNACIQELIDRGSVKSLTHPHGKWQLPKETVEQRERGVIEGREMGKTNGQIAEELGIDLSGVEKIVTSLIKQGRIERAAPVPSALRTPAARERAQPDSPIGISVPFGTAVSAGVSAVVDHVASELGKVAKIPPVEMASDPFAGIVRLITELNKIPGVKAKISISLGVGE